MKRIVLLFVLACLLMWAAGCSSDRYGMSYVVRVSPKMDATLVDEALTDWERAVGHPLFTMEISSQGCDIGEEVGCIAIEPRTAEELDHNHLWGQTTRAKSHDSANVRVNQRLETREASRQTLEHELGHAMGLDHEDDHVLMAPTSGVAAMTITCEDVRQFYGLRGVQHNCNP